MIPEKTFIIYGTAISQAALFFYGLSLEYREVEESEKSGFLGRLFLMDLEFDGKNPKAKHWLPTHQKPTVTVIIDYWIFSLELFICPESSENSLYLINYRSPHPYIVYCYVAYLCLCFFPFLTILIWSMKTDPVSIFVNSTLLDLETGYMVPSLVLGIYCYVAFGTVYQVVESMVIAHVSLAVLSFWLTAHQYSPGDLFIFNHKKSRMSKQTDIN